MTISASSVEPRRAPGRRGAPRGAFTMPELLLVMLVITLLTAMAVVREKEIGTLEQLMVSPIRSRELILGKSIPFILIG